MATERVRRGGPACAAACAWAAASVVCLCLLGAAASSGASLPVRVLPSAPAQGDTLTVWADVSPADAAVTFDGRAVAVYAAPGGGLRALVATDPDVTAGLHEVGVVIRDPRGGARRVVQAVRLAPGRFGVRRLTLPPRTFGLITPANLAAESRILGPVLSRRTPRAWWNGPFVLPSSGPIDSPYGEQGVYNGHREWWHMGVDFVANEGAPVRAANAGVVALARSLPLGGNTVVIDHGQGVLTEYLHLSAFAVREGEVVRRGAPIGRIGATGLVTGPSLHWALYVNGLPVDPLFWTTRRDGLTAP